ncbi:MAG: DMT family transporter [Armatimonadia bacterium]
MSSSTRGMLVMVLSAVFFALMAGLVRGMEGTSAYVMVMARFVIGTLVCVGLFAVGLDRPRWTNWPWIITRGVVGGVAVVIFYWTIKDIGLAKATMLNYTYVVWAAVVAVPLLHERLGIMHWLAIAVALLGIVLLFDVRELSVGYGEALALFGALCSGVAVICVTRCRETDSSTNIFWSQSLFGIGLAAWPMTQQWVMPTTGQWAALVGIGLLAAVGQLAMTYAYKHTGATQGSLLSLVTPVLSALMGVLYFHEAYNAGFVIGSALILGACGYMAVYPVGKGGLEKAGEEDESFTGCTG